MRYFVKLAYNGIPFFGWQIQPNRITVQAILQDVFSRLLKQPIIFTGCGRTDTGVHAKCFYAHFDCNIVLNVSEKNIFLRKVNSFLPKEIVVYNMYAVPPDAHARYDAIERTYRYYIAMQKDPFNFHFAYRFFMSLNVEKMNAAAEILLQTNDFTSFCKLHSQTSNNTCQVSCAKWYAKNGLLVFEITANRFLRNMVRAIVGTLLKVGKEKMSITCFQRVIEDKNRCSAGESVPAHALFLENVTYNYKFE
ncbi:MAG: tRNA pseudouridine(38-40) synthase TruA [Bacteroidales bacterium]|jgi:tRNA pseudouridine38-40 synthase|nr:tRNA pseudouridine(38-40) synthase TruA [Bacteroidales bacterium]